SCPHRGYYEVRYDHRAHDQIPDDRYRRSVRLSSSDHRTGHHRRYGATVLQYAVDAATDGDTVQVSNGVYATGRARLPGRSLYNRVTITNGITVRSVNGPEVTVIEGEGPEGSNAVRCVYLNRAVLSGFTLTNGHTRRADLLTNYDEAGGGLHAVGASVISNCMVVGNRAGGYGGGARLGAQTRMVNCTLRNNHATFYFGGGVIGGRLDNCIIRDNVSNHEGGGAENSTLYDCLLIDNRTLQGNGGGANGGSLFNCLVRGNHAAGRGGGVQGGAHDNCTIVDNTAGDLGGGVYNGSFRNCIVYENRASSGSNYLGSSVFSFSCTAPLPGGEGNITGAPLFIDTNSLNYRLRPTSPCIHAGTNQIWMAGATDLDGRPRIVEGVVDMGAYEYPVLLIDVTNLNDHVHVDVTTYTVGGSNNASLAGGMWWTNSAGGGGRLDEAVGAFTISNINLAEGPNVITVMGTNWLGHAVTDSVTIVRSRLLDDGGATPIHYVSTNGANIWPYTNWSTAATVIQHAVDTAMEGDTVLVSNGVYASGGAVVPGFSLANRVLITNAITVRSVNGPEVTSIKGEGPEGSNAVRCVYLEGAVLSGFTLTNGYTRSEGGLTSYDDAGGGLYALNVSTISNCMIVGNHAGGYGGGAYLLHQSRVYHSTFRGNKTTAHDGGGVHGGRLYNCAIRDNVAVGRGGGAFSSVLYDCRLIDNRAEDG
ncbi:MAG: choice-of-anchor Q domain-containing protein, partial [Verrucomicrobiota bacterium]